MRKGLLFRLSAAVAAAMATMSTARAATAPTNVTVVGATVGTQVPAIVYRGDQIKPFIDAAATRRVDLAGIGDSNQLFGGDGHDYGVQTAWGSKFGEYATDLMPVDAVQGWQTLGTAEGAAGNPAFKPASSAPSSLSQYAFNDVNSFPSYGAYLTASQSIAHDDGLGGLYVPVNSPIGVTNHLKWHVTYGTFPGKGGNFYPTARSDQTAWIDYAQTAKGVSTGATGYGLKDYTIDVPAGSRGGGGLIFREWDFFGAPLQGPFFALNQRLENVNQTKGIGYSTLLYQGGRTARSAAQALQAASNTSLREWIREEVQLQNGKPMLLLNIDEGGNDVGFPQLSVGPHPAPSNTAPGFVDNIQAIINRVRQVWGQMKYDPHNLFFVVGAYHPVEDRMDVLQTFELATEKLAASTYNVAVVRGSQLISGRAMASDGYYAGYPSEAHLTQSGYANFDRLSFTQLYSAAEPQAAGAHSKVSSLSIKFKGDVSGNLTPSDLLLKDDTTGKFISSADMSVTWDATTDTATWTFPGLYDALLPDGHFTATLMPIIGGQAIIPGKPSSAVAIAPEPTSISIICLVPAYVLLRRRRD